MPDEAERAPYALPYTPHLTLTPRPYQRAAVDAWLRADGRGVVVLPTGAGKTVVAFDAIARMSVRTLVVVPTIELLRQWRSELTTRLGLEDGAVGIVGGGERTVGPITVITYDSAAMPRRKLDGFGLLVFDEAHHLPGEQLSRHRRQSARALAAGTERDAGARRRAPSGPGDADRAGGLRARGGRTGGGEAHRRLHRAARLCGPHAGGGDALRGADGRVEILPGDAARAAWRRPWHVRATDPPQRLRSRGATSLARAPRGAAAWR